VLGWSGLAIDPLVEFAADYQTHRPRTKFFPMFVSNRSDERAKLAIHVGRSRVHKQLHGRAAHDRGGYDHTGRSPED
jgi:hypothetical protein